MLYITFNSLSNFFDYEYIIRKKAIKFCEQISIGSLCSRLEVLKIIGASKKPIKAYEILEKLGEKIPNPKPPTAYRAIDFWLKHNFIHRIESLNSYAACSAEHFHNGSHFMICDDCGDVIESHSLEVPELLRQNTEKFHLFPKNGTLRLLEHAKNAFKKRGVSSPSVLKLISLNTKSYLLSKVALIKS